MCVCVSGKPHIMGTKYPHKDGNMWNPCPCGDICLVPVRKAFEIVLLNVKMFKMPLIITVKLNTQQIGHMQLSGRLSKARNTANSLCNAKMCFKAEVCQCFHGKILSSKQVEYAESRKVHEMFLNTIIDFASDGITHFSFR